MAVRNRPCLLTLRKGFKLSRPSMWIQFSTSSHLEARDKQLGVKQDHLPCRPTGTSSGNHRRTETWMVHACHVQWLLQCYLPWHLGRWATPWLADEMLDGQHQRVDIPTHARNAHRGLLKKRLEEDFAESSAMSPWQPYWTRNWTDMCDNTRYCACACVCGGGAICVCVCVYVREIINFMTMHACCKHTEVTMPV